jgi:hypothetical protein
MLQKGAQYPDENIPLLQNNQHGALIAQSVSWLDYKLDGSGSIPEDKIHLSLLQKFKNGCGTHPDSYSIRTGGSFPRDKAAGA